MKNDRMDPTGLAGAAAIFGAGSLYYGIATLYVAIVYSLLGVLHYPAHILGGLQVWVGASFALAAGRILQTPANLPDLDLLALWTAAICCAILAIVFARHPEVYPELEPVVERVGLGVLIPMIAGALMTLCAIAFYARI